MLITPSMATSALRYPSLLPPTNATSSPSIMHPTHRQPTELQRSMTSTTSYEPPPSAPPKPAHTCPSCSRPFSRAEHLERHLATHLPSNSSKCFVCQSCLKGFTRKDVLTRHIRAVHETKRSDVRRSRRRSCKRCAGFKIKCSGGGRGMGESGPDGTRKDEACEACRKRGVECVYDFGNTLSQEDNTAGEAKQASPEDEDMEEVSDDIPAKSAFSSRRGSNESEEQNKRRKTSLHGDFAPPASSASSYTHSRQLSSTSNIQSASLLGGSIGGPQDSQYNNSSGNIPLISNFGNQSSIMEPAVQRERSNSGSRFNDSDSANFNSPPSSAPRSFYSQNGSPLARSNSQPQPQAIGSPSSASLSHLLLPHNVPTLNPSRSSFSNGLEQQAVVPQTPSEETHTISAFPRILPTSYDRNAGPSRENHMPQPESSNGSTLPSVSFLVGFGEGERREERAANNSSIEFTAQRSPIQGVYGASSLSPLHSKQHDPVSTPQAAQDTGFMGLNSLDSMENFFFDFSIFETDWLRGPVESDATPPSSNNGKREKGPPSISGIANRITAPSCNSPSLKERQPPEDISGYRNRRENENAFQLPCASPINEHNSLDDFLPWGWQNLSHLKQQKITLPPLRKLLEECSTSSFDAPLSLGGPGSGMISDRIRNDFISLLSIPYERQPYEGTDIDMTKFPPKDVIDGFILLYFQHFHDIIPIIHRPTFNAENCPTIVLVAMASIGASYSDVEGARIFADTLSELCKRTLTWMADYNPAYLRSEFYLTAFCLQSFYALGCGNYRLYDSADATRSSLVANARRIGLFSDATNSVESNGPPLDAKGSSEINNNSDLETRWTAWRDQEKRKRLAWAIFEYDCCFATLSNRKGSICINDITARLPCCGRMWEAQTAQEWMASLPPAAASNSTAYALAVRGLPFTAIMRDFTQNRVITPISVPLWSIRLCAQALCRLLWDFKELEETAMGGSTECGISGLGLCSLAESLRPTKKALLLALTSLSDVARRRNDGDRGDRVHVNLTALTAHYSHLNSAVPTISLILSLARHPTSQPDFRAKKLMQLFENDPEHARMLAYHAGQILAITRSRPVYTPAETMRLFLAGVVLWGVARYSKGIYTGDDAVMIDVDAVHAPHGMAQHARDWVENGIGKAMIQKDEGIRVELCSEQGAKEVLSSIVGLLSRVRFWGLGEEFRRVLEGIARKS